MGLGLEATALKDIDPVKSHVKNVRLFSDQKKLYRTKFSRPKYIFRPNLSMYLDDDQLNWIIAEKSASKCWNGFEITIYQNATTFQQRPLYITKLPKTSRNGQDQAALKIQTNLTVLFCLVI